MSIKFPLKWAFFLDSPRIQKTFFLYFIFLMAFWAFVLFFSPWNPDYTAGELYDTFLAWGEQANLYFTLGTEPFRVLNYPPLFFYLVQTLNFLSIPALLAGKLLSFCSAILSFFVLYLWCRRLDLSKSMALGIVALSGSAFPLLYPLAQFHLQWPAIALSLSGLYLLNPFSFRNNFFGITLLVLACFIKQTQVITWFIACFWIFLQNQRQGLSLFFFSLLVFALMGLTFEQQQGGEMWKHIFTYTIGTFSLAQLARQTLMHVVPWILFLSLGFWRLGKIGFKKEDLTLFYWLGQTLWIFSAAREGASYQYFMEWSLALLLWIAPLCKEHPPSFVKRLFDLQAFLGILAISLLLGYHASQIRNLKSTLPSLCKTLSSSNTPIVSDDPGLMRACMQKPALHPFIFHNLAKRGLWNEEVFQNRLREKAYDFVVLSFDLKAMKRQENRERWSSQSLNLVAEHYKEQKQLGPFHFWIPR